MDTTEASRLLLFWAEALPAKVRQQFLHMRAFPAGPCIGGMLGQVPPPTLSRCQVQGLGLQKPAVGSVFVSGTPLLV